ncbi:MAG: hypothetical protein DYG89_34595 [Caldilinea sp. CFX5]|nr:hypothetical protein [Caldilinea sp. CFX5]
MHRSKPSAARVHTVVLAVYTLAALLLTWPLFRHFTTHVPGDGIDDPSLAWNLWWIKERLIDQRNLDIFHVDWMFHPININLGFYTLTPLNGFLSVPFQTAFSLIIASNLILLSSFVIGGFGAYLLATQELKTQNVNLKQVTLAAFCAGFVYAFASSKLFYVSLGQFNIASSQWVPFCALYLLRLSRATSWRSGLHNACLAGLFLTLQAWAELTYASFLLIFAALVFLWSLFTGSRNTQHPSTLLRASVSRVMNFIICGFVFAIGIAPFLWAMIPDLRREGDFFASGGGFADTFSADLAGYLLPTRLHPFFGDWVIGLSFPNDKGQQIFLGYSVMLLAIIGSVALARRSQQRWWGAFWLVATLFFGWMTLGAQVRWLGDPLPISGPFDLVSRLPFFSGNRYPSRYSVLLLLCVAVLVGAGVAWLLQRVEDRKTGRQEDKKTRSGVWRRGAVGGVVMLFLLEHLSIPLPLSDFRTPPLYERLAAEPGDFAVLELPTGWRNGARVLGKSDILIMMQQWYQTTHGKRRLGGNTSRNPPYKFQYFTGALLIGDLIALMNAEPNSTPANAEIARVVDRELDTIIARNRPIAGQVLDFLKVRYVTVHVEKSPPALLRFVDEALPLTLVEEWHGNDWSGAASTIRLYQVNPTDAKSWAINLATPEGQLYLAEGWSALATDGVRYATRPCATIMLNLPATGGQLAFELPGPQQNAMIYLNGQLLAGATLPAPDLRTTLQTPAGSTDAFSDRVELCFERRTPLVELAATGTKQGWPIGKTGVTLNHSLVVQSAGNDVGNFAHIFVDGVEVSPNQVGYNLVALDAAGVVQSSKTFNTLASPEESQALADWLQPWPAGTIIAGAVRDEASMNLTETAVNALKTIGLTTDLRERFRWSHAFVGVVGATPGSALEAATLLQPAAVSVGIAVDAPTVYGGVGRIQFTANP